MLTAKQIKFIREELATAKNPLFFYDDDPDGLCSFLLFYKIHREGKGVIVISGLGLSATELKKLASKLKKLCGSGGSVVNETIEIQGDKRDLIKAELEKQNFKVKFIGG